MPAGYGNQCERCYWRELLQKRIQIDVAAFSVPQIAAAFEQFGGWLGQRMGQHKAALRVHRYLSLFIEIEHTWKAIPDYGTLLAHFGASGLRQVVIPVQWMEQSGYIRQDAVAKQDHSEKRRIAATLDRLEVGSCGRAILDSYYNELVADFRAEKIAVRSIRLALRPAAALLIKAREMKCIPPNQKALDAYLSSTPGQRAAVSGFLRYLRDQHGAELTLPKADSTKAQEVSRKKLQSEILRLMQETDTGEKTTAHWLKVSLSYFHKLPKNVGETALKEGSIEIHEDGSRTLKWKNKAYWIPPMGEL